MCLNAGWGTGPGFHCCMGGVEMRMGGGGLGVFMKGWRERESTECGARRDIMGWVMSRLGSGNTPRPLL